MKLAQQKKRLEKLAPKSCPKCGGTFFCTDEIHDRVFCFYCGESKYAQWSILKNEEK